MKNDERIVRQTRAWVEKVVVGCNFCPFARAVIEQQGLEFRVSRDSSPETALQSLIHECRRLDDSPGIETTLLILPDAFGDFYDFLELVELAEALMTAQGYEGVYQLASFHPRYRFADAPADDPANYTNRSPWPMLHLLRESSIEKALHRYPDNPEEIPRRNIEFARSKGVAFMQGMLEACYLKES